MSYREILIPKDIVRNFRLGDYRNIVYSYIYLNTDKYGIFTYDRKEFIKFIGLKGNNVSKAMNTKVFNNSFETLLYIIKLYSPILSDDCDKYIVNSNEFDKDIKHCQLKLYLDDDIDCVYVNSNIINNDLVLEECKNIGLGFYNYFNFYCLDNCGIPIERQKWTNSVLKKIQSVNKNMHLDMIIGS